MIATYAETVDVIVVLSKDIQLETIESFKNLNFEL
jgi:hypothetical protein